MIPVLVRVTPGVIMSSKGLEYLLDSLESLCQLMHLGEADGNPTGIQGMRGGEGKGTRRTPVSLELAMGNQQNHLLPEISVQLGTPPQYIMKGLKTQLRGAVPLDSGIWS